MHIFLKGRARCSHFLAICYLANAVFKHKKYLGVPCPMGCLHISGPQRLPVSGNDPFKSVSLIREYYIGCTTNIFQSL